MFQKSKILVLVIAVLLGGALYFAWPKLTSSPSSDSWKTFIDTRQGISFQYPEKLSTTYISAQEWPPVVKVEQHSAYPCPAGSREADGKSSYCIQTQTEGAAGSVYTTYVYSTGSFTPGKTVSITFALRYVQCGNYGDPQKLECEQERQTFDLDGLVDRIAHSIVFQK